jgi:anti-sigma B factor antagonist
MMAKQGSMRLLHANEVVMEVFEVTGFIDILNIE